MTKDQALLVMTRLKRLAYGESPEDVAAIEIAIAAIRTLHEISETLRKES